MYAGVQGQENTISGQADRFDWRRHRQHRAGVPHRATNGVPAVQLLGVSGVHQERNAQSDLVWIRQLPDGGDSPLSVHLVEPHERLPFLLALKHSIIRTILPAADASRVRDYISDSAS